MPSALLAFLFPEKHYGVIHLESIVTAEIKPAIKKVVVRGLFGSFAHSLPPSDDLPNPAILYGDNGVGKSTVLRIIFHMLSSAGDRGHRNALLQSNFDYCRIELQSGHVLTAERRKKNDKIELVQSIHKGRKKLVEWVFVPGRKTGSAKWEDAKYIYDLIGSNVKFPDAREKPKYKEGEVAYLEILKDVAPTVYYLNAERRLDSDAVADPNDEVELRHMVSMDEPRRVHDLVLRSREIALAQALTSAARWVQRQAVRLTNEGSTNVHSVYVDVIERITSGNASMQSAPTAADDLLLRLRKVTEEAASLAVYELTPSLDTSEFSKSLRSTSSSVAVDLLTPYVRSLETRLNALLPIYNILDTFVKSINEFLVGKSISFTLSKGFEINTDKSRLDPQQLSSGEQQLILLFCYVLVARDRFSVFMIDEPEISLNVKWQRKLLQSLEEITRNASIQFLLASHSVELIAQRRHNVVRMVIS